MTGFPLPDAYFLKRTNNLSKPIAGFEISGKINRKEFGLKWGAITEAGSVVVSEEVRLVLNVQLAKAA